MPDDDVRKPVSGNPAVPDLLEIDLENCKGQCGFTEWCRLCKDRPGNKKPNRLKDQGSNAEGQEG